MCLEWTFLPSREERGYELNEVSWWAKWVDETVWVSKNCYAVFSDTFKDEYFYNRGGFTLIALAAAAGDRATIADRPRIARSDLILSIAEARKIACVLAADPAAEAAVRPRPNPTLREEEGAFTFWRFASVRNANDDESLSRVKDHPVLRITLEESAAHVPLPELRRRVRKRMIKERASRSPSRTGARSCGSWWPTRAPCRRRWTY
jgi:hypothetical protein